ncbi:uncharacterized protein LOC123519464 [Portunus trituberculatus]|uniref:uncharacterized protein LOC123519464 n=1 Tax=Portunus trituberculatus TaxID=210409 RepID=UPI001E1CC24B|nr:uncharacterized protein LOC123519464 [Portunus trituberculatus]
MRWGDMKEFVTSTHSILKLLETADLVTAMTLFLAGNRCQSIPMYVSLYVLPIVVCLLFLLISYITAVMVTDSGRNPYFIPTWARGESWLNVLAALLMVVGATLTLTRAPCSDTALTVTAVALGYICAVMFGCSGAITYLALVQHQERSTIKVSQEHKDDGHIATLAGIF